LQRRQPLARRCSISQSFPELGARSRQNKISGVDEMSMKIVAGGDTSDDRKIVALSWWDDPVGSPTIIDEGLRAGLSRSAAADRNRRPGSRPAASALAFATSREGGAEFYRQFSGLITLPPRKTAPPLEPDGAYSFLYDIFNAAARPRQSGG